MVKERAALAGLWNTLEAAVLMFLPLVLVTSSFVFPRAAFAQFIGPPSGSPGSTAGAIGVNAAHNISVGTSTPSATSKLLIVASSSADTSNYSLQILYPNQQPVLIVRNDGSIGVGTSSPAYALDVVGSIRSSGSIYGTFSGTVVAANVTGGVFSTCAGCTNSNFAFPLSLGVGTSSQVGLPQTLSVYGGGYLSGNVGIGTTTPAMSLDVIGTGFRSVVPSGFADVVFGTASKQWTLYPSGSDLRLFEYGSIFGSSGNDRVTFQAGGNVGIGTSSPASLFTVATSTNILNVLSSGNVGVGTTTPAYSLTVQGNAYVSGNLTCGGTGCGGQWTTTSTGIYYNGGNVGIGTASPGGGKLVIQGTTADSSANGFYFTDSTGQSLFTIRNDGNVGLGGTASGNPKYRFYQSQTTATTSSGLFTNAMFFVSHNPGTAASTTVIALRTDAETASGNANNYQQLRSASYETYHYGTGNLAVGYGSYGSVYNQSTGSIGNAAGSFGLVTNVSGGTITSAQGVFGGITQSGVGGTISNAFALYASNPTVSAGSITNNYGVYIENQTAGTNNYSIYSAGGVVYVAGNVGIATTSPAYPLDVVGTIRGTTLIGSFSGNVNAANITGGVFSTCAGCTNSNFAFPLSLGVGTSSQVGLPQALSVYGSVMASSTLLGGATTSKQVSGGPELITAMNSASNHVVMWSGVPTDSFARYIIAINGLNEWGAGVSSDQDIALFRNSAGNLTVQSFNTGSTNTFQVNTSSTGTGAEVLGVDTINKGIRVNGASGGTAATLDVLGASGKTAFRIIHATAGDTSFSTAVSGDAYLRFAFLADGTLKWATGSVLPDVGIARIATSSLSFQLLPSAANVVTINTAATGAPTVNVSGSSGLTAFRVTHATAGDTSFATAVSGDSYLRFSFLANGAMVWGPGTAGGDVELYRPATSTLAMIGISSPSAISVGIGTTTPAYTLTVAGNIYATGNVTCGGSCGGGGLSGGQANYIPIWTSATAQGTSTIYQSGSNVGIGTTGPNAALHVSGKGIIGTFGATGSYRLTLAGDTAADSELGIVSNIGNLASDYWLWRAVNSDKSMRLLSGSKAWPIDNTSSAMLTVLAGGNVGIGTTAPAAKLDITGSSGQTGLRVIHATAGDTSFATAVSGDSFLRFNFLANGLMTWGGGSATADVQLLRNVSGGLAVQGLNGVSSTQAFNVLAPNGISILDVDTINQLVGVGTTTPAQALHVYKGNTATYLRVEGASDGSNFAGLELRSVEATPNMWQFVQKTNHDFKFAYFNGTSWSTPVLIQAGTGNVGIGTSAPIATLHVSGQVYSSVIGGNNFVLNTSGANYGTIANIASQQWALGWSASTSTLGTSVISWNGNGLVGIDSTAPQATLHVAGQVYANATGNNGFLLASVGSNYGTISNPSQNVWALGYGTATSSLGTSVLTWTSGGLVGIGASSPITTLHVGGQIYSSVVGGVNFVMNASGANYGNISNNSGAWSLGYSTATSTIGTAVLTWTSSNSVGVGRTPTTYAFEVQGDAGKTGGTGSWNIISDVRVKTGISGLTDAIGVINSLHPVEYHFQPWYLMEHPEVRDVPYYGFISQEFQKVFPYNVTKDQNGYLWLNDGSVAPYLVAATQEFSRVIKVDDSGNLVLASANGRVTVNGGLQVASDSPRPPCDSSTRGTFRVAKSSGAPGTSDKVEVCLWSNDSYQWRLVALE